MKLPNDDAANKRFQDLDADQIPRQLNDEGLPLQMKAFEAFVCQVFSSSGLTPITTLRCELFRYRNLEGEIVPPIRASLVPHLVRTNFMAMRDKTYPISCPNLPSVKQTQNRRDMKDGMS